MGTILNGVIGKIHPGSLITAGNIQTEMIVSGSLREQIVNSFQTVLVLAKVVGPGNGDMQPMISVLRCGWQRFRRWGGLGGLILNPGFS